MAKIEQKGAGRAGVTVHTARQQVIRQRTIERDLGVAATLEAFKETLERNRAFYEEAEHVFQQTQMEDVLETHIKGLQARQEVKNIERRSYPPLSDGDARFGNPRLTGLGYIVQWEEVDLDDHTLPAKRCEVAVMYHTDRHLEFYSANGDNKSSPIAEPTQTSVSEFLGVESTTLDLDHADGGNINAHLLNAFAHPTTSTGEFEPYWTDAIVIAE